MAWFSGEYARFQNTVMDSYQEPLQVNVEEKPDVGEPSPSPSRGLTLSWHKLSVWVKKKDEEKSTWFTKRTTDTKILSKGHNDNSTENSSPPREKIE